MKTFLVSLCVKGLPRGHSGKEYTCPAGYARDVGSITGLGRPFGERNANPFLASILAWKISWTEEPGGYSPRSCKELDTTEHTWRCVKYCLRHTDLLFIYDSKSAGCPMFSWQVGPGPSDLICLDRMTLLMRVPPPSS